jgi:cobalt-zinc-cadmium efflux system membrane fusion protein
MRELMEFLQSPGSGALKDGPHGRYFMKACSVALLALAMAGCKDASSQEVKEVKGKPPVSEKAQLVPIQTSLVSTGHAQADIRGLAKVVSPLGGVVEQIMVGVGAPVKRGEPLAVINSADISDLYSSYLSNQAQLYQTERLYALNKELFEKGIVTRSDFLAAEGNLRQIQATLKGQEAKMRQYGVTPGEAFVNTFTILAPIDGVLAELYAHLGDRIDTTNPIALVANPQEMLVVADLHDVDLPFVGPKGSEVQFSTDLASDKVWTGRILYVGDVQDPDTKTIKVYIKVKEDGVRFRQNMFFKIKILGETKMFPSVPKSALVYRDGKFYVYLLSKEAPALKEVKPVRDLPGDRVAIEGISVDDLIIVSAMDQERP